MTGPHPLPDPERERFVDDLLDFMSLREKIGQLVLCSRAPDTGERAVARDATGFFARLREGRISAVRGIRSAAHAAQLQRIALEETRLGIPLLFAADTGSGIDTIMPSPAATAASWDADAIERAEHAIAQEAAASGINWALAPQIDLAGAGIDAEYAASSGADPHLAALTAVARIRGLQRWDAVTGTRLLACLEMQLGGARSDIAPHMRGIDRLDVALAAIREGHVGSLALEDADGPFDRDAQDGDAARPLDLLASPDGFRGIMLSEWRAIAHAADHGHHDGIEDLPVDAIAAAVENGQLAETRIDEAARRVLGAKFDLGLFRGALGGGTARGPRHVPRITAPPPDPRSAALDLARRSIVLLRNDPALLPLGIDSGDILIVGTPATDRVSALSHHHDDTAHGPSAPHLREAASLLDGLDSLGLHYKYVPGLALRQGDGADHRLIHADSMAIGMACEAARRARTVVLALGPRAPGARGSTLDEAQKQLLHSLAAANPNLVVVTLGARPIDPRMPVAPLSCLLHAGQLGTISGHAIAQVLTGAAEPLGRLPATLHASDADRGFAFGHGLGYARFGLSELTLELGNDRIVAAATLHNRSERSGTETVQLYLRRMSGPGARESRALADFRRVELEAGQRMQVVFEIGGAQIGQYDARGRFAIHPGRFEIALGLSAARTLDGEIALPETVARAMGSLLPWSAIRRRA